MATGLYLFDLLNCGAGPIGGRKIYERGNEIDQVMRHSETLCQRHLGRCYLNALIDLDGITVTDLAAKALGEGDSQLTLAGSGGATHAYDGSATFAWSAA